MKAGNHTFAITNKPFGFAIFKRPNSSQKLRSIDRLLEPRKGQPNTFTSVSVVANSAPSEMRITTVPARAIRPHSVDTLHHRYSKGWLAMFPSVLHSTKQDEHFVDPNTLKHFQYVYKIRKRINIWFTNETSNSSKHIPIDSYQLDGSNSHVQYNKSNTTQAQQYFRIYGALHTM
eukprot:1573213-Amphidinium_carterae.1